MLTMAIGAAFCCVPLAVLFERFVPARKQPQPWAANDNLRLHERPWHRDGLTRARVGAFS